MIYRHLFIFIIAIALFSSLRATAQFSMPDNTIVGAEKQYWVDSIAGSGSTYVWKIDDVIQQNGPVNSFTITWNSTGNFFLEVQETSADNCQGEIMSGWVNVTAASVLDGVINTQENVLCFGENNGSVTVTGLFGTGPYEYKIGDGNYQSSGTFSSLPAGDYTVTVRDAMLSTFQIQITITQTEALTVSTTHTNVLCFGDGTGSAAVIVNGGTEPYYYFWENIPGLLPSGTDNNSPATFLNLYAGTYSVKVTDDNGCSIETTITIESINTYPDADFTTEFSEFMTYSFHTNSTNAATTYLWNFGDGQTSVSVNPENTYAETGTYTITLIASNICGTDTTTQQVTVTVPDLEIYNGFSPNDDGINDYWIVPILDYYPVNIVKIINRWGSEVWMGTNYNNTNNLWSGKNRNGVDLPDGTYYYVISYSDVKKRGWVFIKR